MSDEPLQPEPSRTAPGSAPASATVTLDRTRPAPDSDVSPAAMTAVQPATPPDGATIPTLGSASPSGNTAAPLSIQVPGYEILGELGRGGMGVVYQARQIKANRVVALKMILASRHASIQEQVRFQIEAEAVARLQHPNIVQLHEVGEHDGLPYFTLEFCDGGSLDRKLKGEPLPPKEGAALAEKLARATHYAHTRGVVHRDLKPANILLVFSRERSASAGSALAERSRLDDAEPKIADFGLAKQMDSGGDLSRSGAILGTPGYMAPEQARGQTHEIGPSADIYALGAILYELLTGRPPFKGASAVETLELVTSTEPVPVSRHRPQTPRDLETICLKCLHKEPGQRYATAADLADDLGRFLRDEPILARPVGTTERLWRWCRRRPGVAALLAALALVIATGLVSVTILWRRSAAESARAQASEADAKRQQAAAEESAAESRRQHQTADEQRARAVVEADKAKHVAEFLAGIFEAADPLGLSGYGSIIPKASGEALTVREVLDRGKDRIDADTSLAPETRALVKDRIGNAYLNLSELDRAAPLLREAYDLRLKVFGPDSAETAASLHNLARLAHVRGDYFAAEDLYRKALAARLRLTPRPERELADTEFNLAWLLAEMEDFTPAAELFSSAIERRSHALGPRHREVGVARVGLAGVYIEQTDYLKAVEEMRLAREVLLEKEGTGKLAHAATLFQEAVIAQGLTNNNAEAERKLIECHAIMASQLGKKHMYLTIVLFQLGSAQEQLHKYDDAERHYRECLDIVRSQVGLTHPKAEIPVYQLTNLLRERGKVDEASKLFDEWLAAHRARPGPFLADALTLRGEFLYNQGNFDGERAALEEALGLFRGEPTTPRRHLFPRCMADLSWNYYRAGRYADAERLARENLPLVRRRFGDRGENVGQSLNQLATIRLAQRKTDTEVEAWLKEARSILQPALPFTPAPPVLTDVLLNLSCLYRLRAQPAAAVEFSRAARDRAKDARRLLAVAREFAWCSSDLIRLHPRPTAEQTSASRHYADEAVTTLRLAVRHGLKDAAALRKEGAFAALQARADFAELLREMEKPRP